MVVLAVFRAKERSLYFERPNVNKDLQLWKSALSALHSGEECVLLVVVESLGSSPGRAGFKALVTSGGALFGSIGGGSMEHKLVELARARLAHKTTHSEDPASQTSAGSTQTSVGSPEVRRDPAVSAMTAGSSSRDPAEVSISVGWSPFLKRQIHRADEPADRSGMICSGEQTVGFYLIQAAQRALIEELVHQFSRGEKGAAGSPPFGGTPAEVSGQSTLRFDQHGISISGTGNDPKFLQPSETEWAYMELITDQPRIVILGAGHIGLALSRTMHQLGFHVHLMDDRADLNTIAANQWANERSVVDYAQIGAVIAEDPDLYVVLVSFGYRTDDILVRQLIRKRFKYLGMMGSVEKIKTLFEGLRKDGFSEEETGRVRAPIGLSIGSKTPEEIAVSIAAEVIQIKNRP